MNVIRISQEYPIPGVPVEMIAGDSDARLFALDPSIERLAERADFHLDPTGRHVNNTLLGDPHCFTPFSPPEGMHPEQAAIHERLALKKLGDLSVAVGAALGYPEGSEFAAEEPPEPLPNAERIEEIFAKYRKQREKEELEAAQAAKGAGSTEQLAA